MRRRVRVYEYFNPVAPSLSIQFRVLIADIDTCNDKTGALGQCVTVHARWADSFTEAMTLAAALAHALGCTIELCGRFERQGEK